MIMLTNDLKLQKIKKWTI